MSWAVEIEDASLVWQDVSNGDIRSITAGNSSESQVIPAVNIQFAADIDLPAGLLDPETNRERARLRITDNDQVRYFRIEAQPGSVSKALDYPTITGRAAAGIITEWPPFTADFSNDIPVADIARQLCIYNGQAVGVVWLAANEPTIPGGRFQLSRADRWQQLRELAEMCGARIRVSLDGRSFHVYDMPSKALTGSATCTFTDAQSLSYEMLRVKNPANAVRVRGEQPDYTRPLLPVVRCAVSPSAIDADGTSTATVTATVYDSSGNLVRHKAIIDDSIAAGSYTSIPVSGCYSVEAVWLNTGTVESPVKGTRVTPDSFTASVITVPIQTTQLFIVSYTQAESVSFDLSDQVDEILGEAQNTTGTLAVSTTNAIGRVIGVYRATDTRRTGTNYFTGGSYTANTTSITLGISPGTTGTAVIVDYEKYNGTPLSASISPSTVLCDATGQATSTVGAGTTVGSAKITAAALGQEGSCWLSLLGSAVDSMTLASDKSQLLAGSSVAGQTAVSETNLTVQNESSSALLSDAVYYVVVANQVSGNVEVSSGSVDVAFVRYAYVSSEHRLYVATVNPFEFLVAGSSTLDVSYNTSADVENTAGTATITATVLQDDASPASDGTPVQFSITGLRDCSISSETGYTSSGAASVTLSAGSSLGTVTVRAICGSLTAQVSVEVVQVITDDTAVETDSYPTGTISYSHPDKDDDDTEDSGTEQPPDYSDGQSICGSRRLVDCDGKSPHVNKYVFLDLTPARYRYTDENGWFSFCVPAVGSYNGQIWLDGEWEDFSWTVGDV